MLLKPGLSPVDRQSPLTGESPLNPSALSSIQHKLEPTKENIVDRRVIAIGCGNLHWDSSMTTKMPEGFIFKNDVRKDVRRILLQDLNDMITAFARVTGSPAILVATAPELPSRDINVPDYLLRNNTTVIASENTNREGNKIKDFARTFVTDFGEPWALEWSGRSFSPEHLQELRAKGTPARSPLQQPPSTPSAPVNDPFLATSTETANKGLCELLKNLRLPGEQSVEDWEKRILGLTGDLAGDLEIKIARICKLDPRFARVIAQEAMGMVTKRMLA